MFELMMEAGMGCDYINEIELQKFSSQYEIDEFEPKHGVQKQLLDSSINLNYSTNDQGKVEL